MTERKLSTSVTTACSEARNRGQFQKGVSGNPGGRPRMTLADGRTLRQTARDHTDDAVAVLVEVMQDANAPKASRVSAAVAILDRGWGKPMQQLEVEQTTRENPFDKLTPEQRQARIDALTRLAVDRVIARRAAEQVATR